MKIPHIILTIFAVLLFVAPVCANKDNQGPPPDQRVEFAPIVKKASYSSRSQIAITAMSNTDLRADDYVMIGITESEMITRRCTSKDGQEKCEKVPQKSDTTAELMREAANKGGDLVVLVEDKKESKLFDAGKKCLQWTTDYGYRYVQNYATGLMELEHGKTQTRCIQYESFNRWYDRVVSIGFVWRHDPELAKTVGAANNLMIAIMGGDTTEVQGLLNTGLDVNRTTNSLGMLPLTYAAMNNRVEMSKYLVSKGAKVNAFDKVASPLNAAAAGGHLEIVRFLLSKKAKVNARHPESGRTPIFAAAESGDLEVMKELLKKKAKVNIADGDGITPLMIAAYKGNIEAVSILLKNKAGVNKQSGVGGSLISQWTPLHFAAFRGDPNVIRLLLESGAAPGSKDFFGYSPYDLAEHWAKMSLEPGEINVEEKQRAVLILKGFGGVTGYMDRSGTMVVFPRFFHAGDFQDGFAPVAPDLLYGYIDPAGKFLLRPQFTSAEPFSEKLALVGKGGYAYELFGEIAWAGIEYGFINTRGEMTIKPGYSNARRFSDGLAPVRDGSKWGFIDRSGTMVIDPQFEDAWYFSEGMAAVKVDDKYGYIDKLGDFVIEPAFYNAGPFSSDLAWISESHGYLEKYGFINRKGEVVIKPRYDHPAYFEGDKALVYGGLLGLPFYIDRTGAKVGKWSQEEEIGLSAPYGGEIISGFSEGLACVRYKGSEFLELLDRQGQELAR